MQDGAGSVSPFMDALTKAFGPGFVVYQLKDGELSRLVADAKPDKPLARNQGDLLAAWQEWLNEARLPASPVSWHNTHQPVSKSQAIADRLRATADLLDVDYSPTDEIEDALDEIDMIRGDVADLLRIQP